MDAGRQSNSAKEADQELPVRVRERVVTDRQVAATYALDNAQGGSVPDSFTLVRARDRQDVQDVMAHAHAHGIPVVPQGARTATTGAARAIEGGIVLNVEALRTVEVNPGEKYALAGPGVVNADLKSAAAEHGLAYPPDPASSATCTIGGNVATNAGGLCCVKYGVTADYIRGLEVVLPGGEVMRTGRTTAKGVAGYDLTGLFVGSEGTLGVVTEVVAKLVPAPDPALTALATFSDLQTCIRAIVALRSDRHLPSLLEVIDEGGLAAIQAYGDYGFPSGCAAALIVQSDRPGHTAEDVQRYADLLADSGADDVAVADDKDEADLLLAGRRVLNTALEARGHRLNEDVCVPVANLGALIEGVHAISDRYGVEIVTSGHAGDGNFHPCLFYDPQDADSLARAEAAFDDLVTTTLDLGGTITGEHGVGTVKAPWLERELGAAEMDRQRRLKAFFDPRGIMNPGKVYPL